jgi:drug/metabolite transporter (DMT)-like permease
MPDVKQKLTLAGFLITLTGAILFSTKAILVKLAFAHTPVDALSLLTLRMAFSLPFYLLTAFVISNRTGNIKMKRRQWAITLGLGITGYYLSSLFDFLGLQYISAGLERLILFLYPTFALLINRFAFHQRMERSQQLAVLLTYAGIGVAFASELQLDVSNPNFYWGSFLVFLCAVTYSIYIAGSGRIIPQIGSNKFTAYAMLAATGGILIHFLAKGNYTVLSQGHELWVYGILLAIVATVVPSFMLSNGMKRIGTNNVAIISGIGPISTILQAHYFLGEHITALQLFGTMLVIIGICLLGWKRKHT